MVSWRHTGKEVIDSTLVTIADMCRASFRRQKSRATQQGLPTPAAPVQAKGPDEDKIKAILERTGYTLDVTTG